MQDSFDFAGVDIAFMREALTCAFGPLVRPERRDPIWQMIRSILGARTLDEDSEPALERLKARWPEPRQLAAAAAAEVETAIAAVSYSDEKAEHIVETLRWIGRERPDFDLSFLRHWPVRDALSWLERFPGVGPKVAAAALNASTLRMRVFIADCHVHRILLRFGFIGPRATAEDARDAVTAAAGPLDADDLLEFFAQLKWLGQTCCQADRAHCRRCPLASRCAKRTGLGRPRRRTSRVIPNLFRDMASADPSPESPDVC